MTIGGLLLPVLVFLSTAVVDAIFVLYTKSVVRNDAVAAASVGSAIHLINAFVVIQYTHDWHSIFPVALGSWTGTYVTVRFGRRGPGTDPRPPLPEQGI